MNEKQLRQYAAELARDCRKIERKGDWTIREWNHSIRASVRVYMRNTRRFHRVHGTWEEVGGGPRWPD
jgi:hypothetical protein